MQALLDGIEPLTYADLTNVVGAETWISHLPEVLPFIIVRGSKDIIVRRSLHHMKDSSPVRLAHVVLSDGADTE